MHTALIANPHPAQPHQRRRFAQLAFCRSLGLGARGFRLTVLAQRLKFFRIGIKPWLKGKEESLAIWRGSPPQVGRRRLLLCFNELKALYASTGSGELFRGSCGRSNLRSRCENRLRPAGLPESLLTFLRRQPAGADHRLIGEFHQPPACAPTVRPAGRAGCAGCRIEGVVMNASTKGDNSRAIAARAPSSPMTTTSS